MLYRATHDLFFYIAAGLVILSSLFLIGNAGESFQNHMPSAKDKTVIVKYEEEDPLTVSKHLILGTDVDYHNVPGHEIKYPDSLSNLNSTNMLMLLTSIIVFTIHVLYGVYFFGDFFTKGGIRNVIVAGSAKRSIFFTSLIVNAILMIVFGVISAVSIVIFALINNLYPIIYLPAAAVYLLALYVTGLTLSSFVVLVVFVTQRPLKALLIVVGFTVLYLSMIDGAQLESAFSTKYVPDVHKWQEFTKETKAQDIDFEWYMPVSGFNMYAVNKADGSLYDDFMTDKPNAEYAGDAKVAVTRVLWRLNITNITMESLVFYVYPMYRDGILLRYIIVSSVYLCIITAAGSVVVKRRDII